MLRIGTRGSQLALWQANTVAARIAAAGGPPCTIVTIKTSGDRLQDAPLSEIGGKRLFVKEIEEALLRADIDLAVHSSKDMPVVLPEGLRIGAVLPREDPLDAIVLPVRVRLKPDTTGTEVWLKPDTTETRQPLAAGRLPTQDTRSLKELSPVVAGSSRPGDPAAVVSGFSRTSDGPAFTTIDELVAELGRSPVIGTSSVRRIAQLTRLIPGARFTAIRGNLDSRLRKLDRGAYDVLVLAAAGLRRLGFASRISMTLPVDACVPAPGQGIVAIEIRDGDDEVRRLVERIDDPMAGAALRAERALVVALGGGCQTPVGALASWHGDELDVIAAVVAPDGSRALRGQARGLPQDAEALGQQVAAQLLAEGAGAILAHVVDSRQSSVDSQSLVDSRQSVVDSQSTVESSLPTVGARLTTDDRRLTTMNAARCAVFIIGAGPGDPELISVRGRRYLAAADVVLYDRQVHARLLQYARADAETIDVGGAAPEPIEQEAICYLLAEKAREGKTVARLKWGDPFFFDSGGSEALFLHEQGVRFEVVPGIPAGVASPAYAGIPITYPGGGDTVSFVRGHEGGSKTKAAVDWASLASLDGTIVCYAGPDRLPEIMQALLSHGRAAGDSAAIVYDGTLPSQATVTGTLEELAKKARASDDRRPAVLVVGRVAGLREHLRWFDARPLFGKRVLVTRPRDEAAELVDRLEAMGAEAVEAPMIRILPPEDTGPLDAACRDAAGYDAIVFASPRAVDAFVQHLLAGPLDLRVLSGVKLCGVGSVTAERLARYGLKVDVTPSEFRAESLVRAISENGDVRGRRFLLPRADIGREIIADELRQRGADVTEVVAYRTAAVEAGREGEPDIFRMLLERRIDVVTFTSASAVRNLVKALGDDPAADLLATTLVASIGPVTAEAASRHGIHTTIVPAQFTVPALVDAIVEHYRNHR